MPSQNLPKPNVPGQNNQPANDNSQSTGDTKTATAASSVSTSTTPSTKATYIFPKTTPGVSSRENPAGRPPEKPTLVPEKSLTQPTASNQAATISAGGVAATTSSPAQKAPLPLGLKEAEEKKVQMPQPFVPNEMKASSKPVITPAGKTLTTEAGLSSEELKLTRPSVAVQKATQEEELPSPPEEATKAPKKKSKFPVKILLIVLLLVILGGAAFFLIKKLLPQNNTPPQSTNPNGVVTKPTEIIDITYWGLWEDGEILTNVFKEFEAKEGIRVDYRKQSHRDYRERLEQALLSGSGPDVFRYHMTWIPMLSNQLAALPTNIMTSAEYQQTFYPIAFQTLQFEGRIVGIPLMYEGLALFYNKEILRNANLSVPTTWSELRGVANQLTVPGNVSIRNDNNITQAGLAIGNASNVDHFADILALLILQNGGDPTDPTSQNVTDALTFYTNFIKQDKVWSNNLPNSTAAFARGEVAMIFAPSWRALDVKQLNPELDFAIAPVPQLSSEENITWASFWAEGVNKTSAQQEAAWKLLKYLSSAEVLRKFYNDASLVRPFGEIYSRVDMASDLSNNELLSAFINDAPNAKSFPMASFTHDNGVNDQLIQYYADAINAVLAGTSPAKALEAISVGVSQVTKKYGLINVGQ